MHFPSYLKQSTDLSRKKHIFDQFISLTYTKGGIYLNNNRIFQPDDWITNAYYSGLSNENEALIEGYARASKHLIEIALENRHEGDYLILPILYLFRHHIELGIKEAYLLLQKLESKTIDYKSLKQQGFFNHKLKRKELDEIIKWGKKQWENEPVPQDVLDIIYAVHEIDPDGQTLRYSYNREGLPNRDNAQSILIGYHNLKEQVEKVTLFIDGMITALSVELDFKYEMEREYNDYY